MSKSSIFQISTKFGAVGIPYWRVQSVVNNLRSSSAVTARRIENPEFTSLLYSVIQKDGLNFVSLYIKIRTSDKYDVNYIQLEVEC
jgi:hypothetical protein